MVKLAVAGLVVALGLASLSPAQAGRAPTDEERSRIEVALRQEGFSKWDEIELEDGVWEVDDAVGADGKSFDVKLDPGTLAIIERKAD